MAKILAKAHRSPVVTSYKPDDLEYTKYENSNLTQKRRGARPASEARVSAKRDSSRERLVKTPTLSHGTGKTHQPAAMADNRVLIKRPESSSSHKYEDSIKKLVQFRKCKTDIKILPDRQRPQTVQGLTRKSNTTEKTKHVSNGQLGTDVRSEKSKQISNDIDNLLRVVRNEKTKAECNDNAVREVQCQRSDKVKVKESSPDLPLREVRRKLQFENVDQGDDDDKDNGQLDFTDKLAAIKTVIDRTRDTRDILDRRAYYNEYKSSQRKVIVSRSDSLKENNGDNINTNAAPYRTGRDGSQERSGRERSGERKDKHEGSRTRDVKSADIFKSRTPDGRLSVDINKLRHNLENKKQSVRDSGHDDFKQTPNHQPSRVYASRRSSSPATDDDLIHAVSDRKILASSSKPKQDAKQIDRRTSGSEKKLDIDHKQHKDGDEELTNNRQNSRPGSRSGRRSRLETRETQTELNHSIHSVQSNVPFYDPGKPITEDVHRNMHRDSVRKTYRKTSNKIQDNILGDIDLEDNINNLSPGRPGHQEEKQTNVADFLGTSLTPEKKTKSGMNMDKEKLKCGYKQVDKDLEHLRSKISWLKDQDKHETESEKRQRSRSKIFATKDHVFKPSTSKSHSVDVKNNRKTENIMNLFEDDKVLKIGQDKLSESAQKVRDWIETQQVTNSDCQRLNQNKYRKTVIVDELSVSVSIKHGLEKDNNRLIVANDNMKLGNNEIKLEADQDNNSSNDTCDKYPVKLAKSENMDTKILQHKLAQSGGRGQGHMYQSHDQLYGNIKEIPVRDTGGPVMPSRQLVPESDSTDTE